MLTRCYRCKQQFNLPPTESPLTLAMAAQGTEFLCPACHAEAITAAHKHEQPAWPDYEREYEPRMPQSKLFRREHDAGRRVIRKPLLED